MKDHLYCEECGERATYADEIMGGALCDACAEHVFKKRTEEISWEDCGISEEGCLGGHCDRCENSTEDEGYIDEFGDSMCRECADEERLGYIEDAVDYADQGLIEIERGGDDA